MERKIYIFFYFETINYQLYVTNMYISTDDFSRVKLEVIDNDPNSDYINASFIKVQLEIF